MSKCYPIPSWADETHMTPERYQSLYQRSINEPDVFWAEQANRFLSWIKPWDTVISEDFSKGHVRWFDGAQLNVTINCIDRHLANQADKTAIIWEADEPGQSKSISYQQLSDEVNRLANVLKDRGVTKGDRVCIYMPMIPEAAYAMLACARIGAVHSVVFGGFSPSALKDRILDSDCQVVITADAGMRGGKTVSLKANADAALAECPKVHSCLVVKHTGQAVDWQASRDLWYHEVTGQASTECQPEIMHSEDPLFILYTSGSTGKPKGVLHTTAGYLLYTAMTHHYAFDLQPDDVYWCGADVGWVTGHSYIVYGPLANGTTTLMFEGVPTYPTASRCWEIIDQHQVNSFYTAPTAIRSLMGAGDQWLNSTSRQSLRILGTVGEPINPEAWEWYYHQVGQARCAIVDTWWQTETGGHMILPIPGATAMKPGSAMQPFFGVQPVLLDTEGQEIEGEGEGSLAIKHSWPGQIRTVFGDHQRLIDTYFSTYPNYYFTGDGAKRDAEGDYWITGRVDDVLNVSGHRLGTAEIESALGLHADVAEAAVVGFTHDIKGQGVYAYVTVMAGCEGSPELEQALVALCREAIGPIAKPDIIQWAPGLPKTRSGKIMRRILRKIAAGELDSIGDTSTLADPSVVDELIRNRRSLHEGA